MKRLIDFIRPYLLAKVLMVLILAQIVATGGLPNIALLLAASATASIALISLTIINDYFDEESDKTRKLRRPIAHGHVSKDEAIVLAAFLFSISILMSGYFLSTISTTILIINIIAILIYSSLKDKTPFTDPLRGYFNGAVALFGGFSVNPENTGVAKLIIVLSALIILTSTAKKIAHSIHNADGIKFKRITIATYYGDRAAGIIAGSLAIIAIFLSVIPMELLGQNYRYLISVADIILAYAGFRLLINPAFAAESQRFIKIGMIIIMISFLVGAIKF